MLGTPKALPMFQAYRCPLVYANGLVLSVYEGKLAAAASIGLFVCPTRTTLIRLSYSDWRITNAAVPKR